MQESTGSAAGRGGRDWSRFNQCLLWIGLAAAVAWLFFRHGEHLGSLLPFLLILACPLMHLFGHRGHGGHRHDGAAPRDPPAGRDAPADGRPTH